jgi:hypothetical protein
VYLAEGGTRDLDLAAAKGTFTVSWFNPRSGGALQRAPEVRSGGKVALTAPSTDDWLAVVRRK